MRRESFRQGSLRKASLTRMLPPERLIRPYVQCMVLGHHLKTYNKSTCGGKLIAEFAKPESILASNPCELKWIQINWIYGFKSLWIQINSIHMNSWLRIPGVDLTSVWKDQTLILEKMQEMSAWVLYTLQRLIFSCKEQL